MGNPTYVHARVTDADSSLWEPYHLSDRVVFVLTTGLDDLFTWEGYEYEALVTWAYQGGIAHVLFTDPKDPTSKTRLIFGSQVLGIIDSPYEAKKTEGEIAA